VCQELVNLELRVAGELGNLTVPDVAKHFQSVLEGHDYTHKSHLKAESLMVRCLSHQLVLADDGESIRVTAHGVVGVMNSFAKLPQNFPTNPVRKYRKLAEAAALATAVAEEQLDEAEAAEEDEAEDGAEDEAAPGHLQPACAASASALALEVYEEVEEVEEVETVENVAFSVPARRPHQHPLGVGVPFGGGAAAAPAGGLFGGSSAGTPAAHAPAGGQIGGGATAAAPAVLPAPTDIVSFGGGGGAAAPPQSSRMRLFENTPPTISTTGSSDVQVDLSLSLPGPEAEPKGGWPKDKANALLRQTLASLNRLSTALAAAEQANAAHQAKFEMLTAVSCAPLRSSVLLPSLPLRFTLRSLPLRLP